MTACRREPTWSPDARYVAYSSDRGGKFDIWVQQVSGGNPIQVTKRPGQNWQPDWSPDGKYIAYRSEEGDGGIFVIPALGGAGLERKIATFGYHPRWSPDSSQVLFELYFTETGSTGSTSPNWMAARRAKSWPSFWLKRNCRRVQPPGIQTERRSPSGLQIRRPLPAFGRYRLRVDLESSSKLQPRSRRNLPRLPETVKPVNSWGSILSPGHRQVTRFISSGVTGGPGTFGSCKSIPRRCEPRASIV